MQELIVGMVVTGAGGYVVLRYVPRNLLVRAIRSVGGNRFASRLEKAACASACGSCGGCGGKGKETVGRNGVAVEELRRTAGR